MNRRGVVRGVVLAVLAFAASPATAKDREPAFTLERTVKFSAGERTELNFKAGPLTFTEFIISHRIILLPMFIGDIKKAQPSDPENYRPLLAVGVSNDGDKELKFHVVVSLEDDAGTVYLKCDREDSIDPGNQNDHTQLCRGGALVKAVDWPKLTVVRIKADVDID